MGRKHDLRPLPGLADNQIPHHIGGHFIGMGGGQPGYHIPDLALVPGGTVGGIQGLNQIKQFHVFCS